MYSIYLISSKYENQTFYKIGWTKRSPEKRLKELKTGNSQDLKIEKVFKSKFGPKIERNLHRRFSSKRKNGEWFELDEDEVSQFENLCKEQNDMFQILIENNTWIQEESKDFQKYL
jgi:hypothetical protein